MNFRVHIYSIPSSRFLLCITILTVFCSHFVLHVVLQNAVILYWKADKSLHELFWYNYTFILFKKNSQSTPPKEKSRFVLKTKRWSQNMQDIVLAFHF